MVKPLAADYDHETVQLGVSTKNAPDAFAEVPPDERMFGTQNVLPVGFPGESASYFRVSLEYGIIFREFKAGVDEGVSL
jgi:hypothetical protein